MSMKVNRQKYTTSKHFDFVKTPQLPRILSTALDWTKEKESEREYIFTVMVVSSRDFVLPIGGANEFMLRNFSIFSRNKNSQAHRK